MFAFLLPNKLLEQAKKVVKNHAINLISTFKSGSHI